MSLFIYEHIYKKIDYLKDRPMVYVTWLCPQLIPMVKNRDQFIYQDGDEVSCIYFLIEGSAGLVLPHFKNIMYV